MALSLGTNCGFVTVAPTDDPAASTTQADTRANVIRHTSPADAAKIVEMGWWCDNATEDALFDIGLYDSDGSVVPGEAGTRLYVSSGNAKGTSSGWIKVTGLDWAISGSHDYWLGLALADTATNTNLNRVTTNGMGYDTLTSTTTLPNPFGGGALSNSNGMMAIYAVYETAGGVSIPVMMHHRKQQEMS